MGKRANEMESKEITKKQSTTINFIDFIIIFGIALPIIFGTNNFYYELQNNIFSNADTLLFVHDWLSGVIIVFSPIIILFCIASNIKINTSIKIMKVKIIRSNIKPSDYGEFVNVFGDDRMKIINSILNK